MWLAASSTAPTQRCDQSTFIHKGLLYLSAREGRPQEEGRQRQVLRLHRYEPISRRRQSDNHWPPSTSDDGRQAESGVGEERPLERGLEGVSGQVVGTGSACSLWKATSVRIKRLCSGVGSDIGRRFNQFSVLFGIVVVMRGGHCASDTRVQEISFTHRKVGRRKMARGP
jgi:hypothetical protein